MHSLDNLVRELVVLCDPNDPNSLNHRDRVREIGGILDRQGGMTLMQEVHAQVAQEGSRMHARILESFWGGVGDWLA